MGKDSRRKRVTRAFKEKYKSAPVRPPKDPPPPAGALALKQIKLMRGEGESVLIDGRFMDPLMFQLLQERIAYKLGIPSDKPEQSPPADLPSPPPK